VRKLSKVRPCVVIGKLQSKTIVPITGWNEIYHDVPWMVKCEPTNENHLRKKSAIDTFQIRNVSIKRFIKKVGTIDETLLFQVHTTVAKTLSIKYELSKV
jgi:mRNA interferase MazF